MNICIPVTEDRGLDSPVCAHFGSAPIFMIVDTESGSLRAIPNRNLHDGHGMCRPLEALAGENLDGMVVGGIGMGALGKLQAARVSVFLSQHGTVGETLAAFRAGSLEPVTPRTACSHRGQGQHGPGKDRGCGHT
jgi:predicted Fe-Mo cluster-binding NifX family protein